MKKRNQTKQELKNILDLHIDHGIQIGRDENSQYCLLYPSSIKLTEENIQKNILLNMAQFKGIKLSPWRIY